MSDKSKGNTPFHEKSVSSGHLLLYSSVHKAKTLFNSLRLVLAGIVTLGILIGIFNLVLEIPVVPKKNSMTFSQRASSTNSAPKKLVFLSRKIGQAHQVYMEVRALDSHTWELIPKIEHFVVPDGSLTFTLLLPRGYGISRGMNPAIIEDQSTLESLSWIISKHPSKSETFLGADFSRQAAHVVLQATSQTGKISSWSINLNDEHTWSPQNTLFTQTKERVPAEEPSVTMGLSYKTFFSLFSFDENPRANTVDAEGKHQPPNKSQRFRPQSLGIPQ